MSLTALRSDPSPRTAMIAALFLSVLPQPSFSFAPAPSFQEAGDAEADAQIAAAGQDVAKLLELAKSFTAGGKDDAAKKTYKKIVEIEPNHAEARKALRHHPYDGKWFESYAALSKYRREETAKMKEKGLARWKDQWVPEGDVPYLNMGWVKDEGGGKWLNPVEVAREKQIAEWKAAGYEFRADDSSWISKEDVPKWQQLLWKCGDEWLDLAKANEYHSKFGQWWQLEGEYFSTWSTCDWNKANQARFWADQVYGDLVRLTGLQPSKKPHFLMLSSMEQYNQFTAGDEAAQIRQIESEGFSTLHHACFADFLFDPTVTPPQFLGCGVGCWVSDGWAPFAARFAAGLSFMEAVDPSWLAVSEIIAAFTGGSQPTASTFWTEKKIPRWMHYGAASYVERFAKENLGDGGNPWQMREDSFKLLKAGGGMRKIEDIFAFTLDLNDIEGSGRLMQEAGLLISFLLDEAETDKKLREKHAAFKAALKPGVKKKDLDEAIEGLQKELARNERDIKKFAGL